MKKSVSLLLAALMLTGALAGCGSSASGTQAADGVDSGVSGAITVISREDGSGTRGAFIELTGVEEKNADGKKVDNTTEAAAIQSSTNGVMTAVANDETAIGYISLGSLSNDVKAVTVGGVEVTGRGSLRSRGLGGGSLGGSGGALCRSRGSSGGIGRAAGSQAQSQRSSGNGSNCRSTFHVCILPFSQIYVV